jgi:hypothetical protein
MCRRCIAAIAFAVLWLSPPVFSQRHLDMDQYVESYGLRVAVSPGPLGDESFGWVSVTGGGFRMITSETTVGTDHLNHQAPPRVVLEPLTLTSVVTGRPAWIYWLTNQLEGSFDSGEGFRAVTLAETDREGNDGAAFVYEDCLITRFVFPVLDAQAQDVAATESFVVQPNGFNFGSLRAAVGAEMRDTVFTSSFRVSIDGANQASQDVASVKIEDLVIPALSSQDDRPLPTKSRPTGVKVPARSISKDRNGRFYFYVTTAGKKGASTSCVGRNVA